MPLTQDQEDAEHQLRIRLMTADITNKRVDTMLKDEQRQWEPWKAISIAVGAAAALFTVIGAALGYLLAHAH